MAETFFLPVDISSMEPLETTLEAISAALKFIEGEGPTEPMAAFWDHEVGTVTFVQHPKFKDGKLIPVERMSAQLTDPIGRSIELVAGQLHGALVSGRLESFVYNPDSETWRRLTANSWFEVVISGKDECFLNPGEEAMGSDLPMAGQQILLSRSAVREWIANTFEQNTELELPIPELAPNDLHNAPATKRAKGAGRKQPQWYPMLWELLVKHQQSQVDAESKGDPAAAWPTNAVLAALIHRRSNGRHQVLPDTLGRHAANIKRII